MRAGDSNWKCCVAFCVYMHVNHCKEIGFVVRSDGPARSSGQSRLSRCFRAFVGEVLNNSTQRKEDGLMIRSK